MRIDCAVTLCDRAKFTYPWAPGRDYTAEDLAPILSRNRFDGAVATAQLDEPAETDWLLETAGRHAWLMAVMTRSPDLRAWDRWQGHAQFQGVESPPVALAAELARRGLIASLAPAQAIEALAAAPSLRVVVRAMAGLGFTPADFDGWARSLEPLVRTKAMVQVDGLINFIGPGGWLAATYQPWVQHTLATFGPQRLMYGSGWPFSMPHATWKESLACFTQAMGALRMEDRAAIVGENAAKFYSSGSGVRYTEGSPG